MRTLVPLPPQKPARTPDTPLVEDQADNQDREVDIMARTLWGEARGEGSAGMEAVACVILNRVRLARKLGGYWWGNDIIQVCHKPYQFSCWNADDPNYKILSEIDATDLYFATALRIARRAVHTRFPDKTDGATHYHAAGISPFWAQNHKPVAVIGHHIFYRLVEA